MGFLKIQFVAKYQKHFRDFENFPKKTNFEQSHSAKKCKRGDPFGFINIHSAAKNESFDAIKKNFEKKFIVPTKIEVKNIKIAKGGSLVCFQGSGRRFCFGRGSDVSSIFWTRIVQVEQMNNKTGTSQVGTISKAQIKSKGDPLETKKSRKSRTVPKKIERGTL